MSKSQNSKHYDLEDRTLEFAKKVRELIRRIAKTITNIEDTKQLARASGSVGANYIEANEALSKKDFVLRIKICRKEAKESQYWLKLINLNNEELDQKRNDLIREATELMKIFGAIIHKSE